MRKVLLLCVLLPIINGIIQVPFIGIGTDYDVKIFFNLSVGTPAQTLQIQLLDDIFLPDLYFPDARTYNVGFNPDKSSTFVNIGDAFTNSEKAGTNGTDTFTFNDGITVRGKPLKVLYDFGRYSPDFGLMGIHRHQTIYTDCPDKKGNCTNFVTSVVLDQKEPVLVFAFDKISPNSSNPFTGQLVFGEKPDKLCDPNWSLMPEVAYQIFDVQEWAVDIDSITVGKYTFGNPGQTIIYFSDYIMVLPPSILASMLKALDSPSEKFVPCNSTTDIIFTLGEFDLHIKPETYLDRYGDVCWFRALSLGDERFELPITALREHCLLYDYKKIQVGITKRLK